MSTFGTLSLASTVGGKIEKNEVESAVERYKKYHTVFGGEEEIRKNDYVDMVNKYYDLATSFYEFGWGESFHFAPRWKGESLCESIRRHEHFIALQLQLKQGMKVLDVGCGIGGPLREIARFSSACITGLNNNEYQISRGSELNQEARVSDSCNFVKGDFMKMPFPENYFDASYALAATCHAPDAFACYKEIYRVLKPGECFAVTEWCMTEQYDPMNKNHKRIKANIEIGNGLPDVRTTSQCLQAMNLAGFEVVWEKDLAIDSPVPWYSPLDSSQFSVSSFRLTRCGRFFTRMLIEEGLRFICMQIQWLRKKVISQVNTLEFIGLAPPGSKRVSSLLELAAEGLAEGGKEGIFTALYFLLVRKPLSNP